MESDQLEEPDVTPLINVNLVILVMVLAIASHAAKLLPLKMPKAEKTEFVEMSQALHLRVAESGGYELGDQTGLDAESVGAAIEALDEGQIVLISMDRKAKYDALVKVLDHMMSKPYLQVAFGQPPSAKSPAGAPTTTAPAGD